VAVTLATVVQKDMPVEVRAIGSVEAYSVVSVQSQVSGELQKVLFQEGDTVKAGQTLFQLDRRPFAAALQEAIARRDHDQVLLGNAKKDANRYQELAGKRYVSGADLEHVQAQADALEASLRADRSAVEAARLNLQYATIRSPIDGRTGSLLVNAGNVVKANDKALVVIRQVKPIYVRFSLPEHDLPGVRARMAEGKPAVEAWPRDQAAAPEKGELSLVENAVDAATGTIELKAVFANESERLWPGQYVDVSLELQIEHGATVAPAAAVQQSRDGEYAFVLGADDTVEQRKVTVLRTVREEAVIGSGLSAGDQVVTDGQMQLVSGAKVVRKPAPGAGQPAAPAAPAAAHEDASP